MAKRSNHDVSFGEFVAEELNEDEGFRRDWQRLAPARQFAAMLIEYRADHGLSQRGLGEKLGVSQPRVARMESGEQNPDVDTIIATIEKLSTEFVLDVGPADTDATLVTKGARSSGAVISHGNVSVTTASARARKGTKKPAS
ncbi:helix-turn-helix transcriptional regulator [Baekduia soli]|nr:helix-turn-helix transcriptional regulator [Baekduia soli]